MLVEETEPDAVAHLKYHVAMLHVIVLLAILFRLKKVFANSHKELITIADHGDDWEGSKRRRTAGTYGDGSVWHASG